MQVKARENTIFHDKKHELIVNETYAALARHFNRGVLFYLTFILFFV